MLALFKLCAFSIIEHLRDGLDKAAHFAATLIGSELSLKPRLVNGPLRVWHYGRYGWTALLEETSICNTGSVASTNRQNVVALDSKKLSPIHVV